MDDRDVSKLIQNPFTNMIKVPISHRIMFIEKVFLKSMEEHAC